MPTQPTTFFVNAYKDPVIVRIKGRADYMNSQPLSDFFTQMLGGGKHRFVVDFQDCTTVDSTFLGILASAAIEVEESSSEHCLVITRLGDRHWELVHNLGLDHILTVDRNGNKAPDEKDLEHCSEVQTGTTCRQDTILKAHEALVEADEENFSKFQDVIAFLKNQVDDT